jgi:hypothetical protein
MMCCYIYKRADLNGTNCCVTCAIGSCCLIGDFVPGRKVGLSGGERRWHARFGTFGCGLRVYYYGAYVDINASFKRTNSGKCVRRKRVESALTGRSLGQMVRIALLSLHLDCLHRESPMPRRRGRGCADRRGIVVSDSQLPPPNNRRSALAVGPFDITLMHVRGTFEAYKQTRCKP